MNITQVEEKEEMKHNNFLTIKIINNMKKTVLNILQIAVLVLCFTKCSFPRTQEITEENYLKALDTIEAELSQEIGKLYEYMQKHPENTDSLSIAYEQLVAVAGKKGAEALIKYASAFDVPIFLENLYRLRLYAPKEDIRSILKTLPDSMQSLPYAKSLLYHVEMEQIALGSKYYDFQAIDTDGKEFALSSLEGKNILLIYGGLHCMGEEGRTYLNKTYRETSRDNFDIVVYCEQSSNLDSLQQEHIKYQCDNYYHVSDFLQDHSPVGILYGAQSTPTCFFIDKGGIVRMKTVGLYNDIIDELVSQKR